MRRFLVLVTATGCGATSIPVRHAAPSELDPRGPEVARCAPARRITVTNARGTPVRDARVVVRQSHEARCPSMGPLPTVYSTDSVSTDARGIATICDPATFAPSSELVHCSGHRSSARVLIVDPSTGDAAVVASPLAGELRAVLGACATARLLDPSVPCR